MARTAKRALSRRAIQNIAGDGLNLSSDEIATYNELATTGTDHDVPEALRRMLLSRYRAYVARGLYGIAPYARAHGGVRSRRTSCAPRPTRRRCSTAQALSGVIAVPGGTMVFYADRVSTAQLTGVGSSLK